MSILIENKDWNRMYDLIVDGKDGAGVARSIKQRDKAIARYVAAMRLLSKDPTYFYNDDTFDGPFCDFANKALELGASYDTIYTTWKQCPEPTDLIAKIKDYLETAEHRVRIPDNFFKELRHAGVPIITEEPKRKAGIDANHAMSTNGRKWNIPLDIRFYPDTYDECSVSLDVITDEGGGPNIYALYSESGLETGLSGTFGYNEMRNKVFAALEANFSDVHFK